MLSRSTTPTTFPFDVNGTKIDTIVHYGRRNIPAELRTVIELGDPPAFDGVTCIDCGRTFRLEWEHDDRVRIVGRPRVETSGDHVTTATR